MSRLSVQAEQDSAPVLGIDEKLAEAGYLTSLPVVVHPKLPPYRYRLYGEDDGRLERIDVFDEQSRRVIQQISWPSDQDDPEPLDGRTPEIHSSDLNFDGYKDLMAVKWRGGTGNTGFVVWMFDPRRRQLAYSSELSDMWNLPMPTASS